MFAFIMSLHLCLLFAGMCWGQIGAEVIRDQIINATDPNAALSYAGKWTNACLGGMLTAHVGDTLTFQFIGTKFSMLMSADMDPTAAEIRIDGVKTSLVLSSAPPSSDPCDAVSVTTIQSPALQPNILHTVTLQLVAKTIGIFSFNFQINNSAVRQPTQITPAQGLLNTSTLSSSSPPTPTPSSTDPPETVLSSPPTSLPTGDPAAIPASPPPTISPGTIAGIAIGALLVIAIGVFSFLYKRRYDHRRRPPGRLQTEELDRITTHAFSAPIPVPFILSPSRQSIDSSIPPPLPSKDYKPRQGSASSLTRHPTALPVYTPTASRSHSRGHIPMLPSGGTVERGTTPRAPRASTSKQGLRAYGARAVSHTRWGSAENVMSQRLGDLV